VRWAIWTATRHQRERVVCFPRAIAAQAMLRRRGVSTTLYYGAASQEGGTREIIESERDQRPLGADRKRFSEHQSRRFSLVIIVKSCPRISRRHIVLLASYDGDFEKLKLLKVCV